MIFDKVYQVRWNNTPLGKSVTVFREKSSGWLFLPRHAEQTGDWVPFVSLDDDIKVMSSGEGDMEIIWEKDSMFPLKNIIKTPYLHVVPNGTHAMILAKSSWFNKELFKLLQ